MTYDYNLPWFTEILQMENYTNLFLGKSHVGYKHEEANPYNKGFDEMLFQRVTHYTYYNRADYCTSLPSYDRQFTTSNSIQNQRDELFPDELCMHDMFNEFGYDYDLYTCVIMKRNVFLWFTNHVQRSSNYWK